MSRIQSRHSYSCNRQYQSILLTARKIQSNLTRFFHICKYHFSKVISFLLFTPDEPLFHKPTTFTSSPSLLFLPYIYSHPFESMESLVLSTFTPAAARATNRAFESLSHAHGVVYAEGNKC